MTSNYAFFAHRLGYRPVGTEKRQTSSECGIEKAAEDGVLDEQCRRRSVAEHKQTWHDGSDRLNFIQVRPTNPLLDKPHDPYSQIHSTPCSLPASFFCGQRTASQSSPFVQPVCDSAPALQQLRPVSEGRALSAPPNRETISSEVVTRLSLAQASPKVSCARHSQSQACCKRQSRSPSDVA